MDHTLNGRKVTRMALAAVLAILLLAFALPSTGGTISDRYPRHDELWHLGGFSFYPVPFFMLIGSALGVAGCTIIGIMRSRWLEAIGWLLLCGMLAHVVASL